MENLSSIICSVADKNDIESLEDKDDGPGFRSIPPIKRSDKIIRSSNKLRCAMPLTLSCQL